MAAATVLSPPEDANSPARRTVSREDLLAAALKLIGPHRSLSTLSLREVAREAGIAPNSFYRQFRDMDELAVALIDVAGRSLRTIIGEARQRATSSATSVVRVSVETFMEQLRADDKLLHVLLREGAVGSDDFKHAVERELHYFEEELQHDLVRLAALDGAVLYKPAGVCDGRFGHGPASGERPGTGRTDLHDDPHDHRRRAHSRRLPPRLTPSGA
jgi:AcrR family transcriptional regulator